MITRFVPALLLVAYSYSSNCPYNSTYFPTTNKCYYANFDPLVFKDALAACRNLGGDLVSIHSSQENDFVLNVARRAISEDGSAVYIGVVNYTNITDFAWSDGSPADYNNYIVSSEHDNTGMSYSGSWLPGYFIEHNSVCEFSPIAVQNSSCPGNSTSYNGKCYFFNPTLHSYVGALEQCESMGGDLVSIHSAEENAFIASQMKHYGTGVYWIGLNTVLEGTKNYTWSDGSKVDYTNFNPDVPGSCINGAQQCVNGQATSGQWFNCWQCNKQLLSVCEISTTGKKSRLHQKIRATRLTGKVSVPEVIVN